MISLNQHRPEAQKGGMRRFPDRAVFAGLLAASALALAGCKPEAAATTEHPAPVRVATVGFAPLSETRRYVGVVRARYESDLGFRVGGKIIERLVNVGDTVSAGAVIARLDATDFRLSLEAQEAELSAALSSRNQAVADEERYRILNSQGHVANAALDQRKATADEARSRVERAQRNLDVQKNQVQYTELKADRAGVISSLPVEVGQVVTAGQPVARLARMDELEAVVAIPEQKLDEVKDAAAEVAIWSGGDKRYAARLREISPEADSASRTFQVRFSIPKPDDDVRLGKTATVILDRDGSAPVARLPLSAVMNDGRGSFVWVVDAAGHKLVRRAVEIQSFAQDAALITAGLKSGERVVTLGVHALDESRAVRVVESGASADVAAKLQ